MILSVHNWAEIVAAVTSSVCLIIRPTILHKWFNLFLWVTVVLELVGKLTATMPEVKFPMYNVFNGLEFLFYLFFIVSLFNSKKWQQAFSVLILLFGVYFSVNLFFLQGLYTYNNNTHTAGCVLIVVFVLSVFYEMYRIENWTHAIQKRSLLAVLCGLLVFYSGNLVNTALLNYLSQKDPAQAISLYKLVNHNLNLVLYLLFTVAFINDSFQKRETGNLGTPVHFD